MVISHVDSNRASDHSLVASPRALLSYTPIPLDLEALMSTVVNDAAVGQFVSRANSALDFTALVGAFPREELGIPIQKLIVSEEEICAIKTELFDKDAAVLVNLIGVAVQNVAALLKWHEEPKYAVPMRVALALQQWADLPAAILADHEHVCISPELKNAEHDLSRILTGLRDELLGQACSFVLVDDALAQGFVLAARYAHDSQKLITKCAYGNEDEVNGIVIDLLEARQTQVDLGD